MIRSSRLATGCISVAGPAGCVQFPLQHCSVPSCDECGCPCLSVHLANTLTYDRPTNCLRCMTAQSIPLLYASRPSLAYQRRLFAPESVYASSLRLKRTSTSIHHIISFTFNLKSSCAQQSSCISQVAPSQRRNTLTSGRKGRLSFGDVLSLGSRGPLKMGSNATTKEVPGIFWERN